jgi:hypothetical protein
VGVELGAGYLPHVLKRHGEGWVGREMWWEWCGGSGVVGNIEVYRKVQDGSCVQAL